MSAFTRVAEKLKHSNFAIPVWLATMLGIVIGCFAFYEDYQSSLHGYNLLPTRKTGQEVVQVIALLPQVGQIIFFYMFGNSVETLPSGRKKFNMVFFLIGGCLLLFDLGTDMLFKAGGMEWYVYIIAFVESITVYSIGSEMLLTASIGIFFQLTPIAFTQLGHVFAGIFGEDEDEVKQRR